MPFWLMCALWGCLLGSSSLSWDAVGPGFGSLGEPWGAIWDVLGHLFRPSWPKSAQDTEKTRFFEFEYGVLSRFGSQIGTKNREKSTKNQSKIKIEKKKEKK